MDERSWSIDMTTMDLQLDGILPSWAPRPRFVHDGHCAWGIITSRHGEVTLWLRPPVLSLRGFEWNLATYRKGEGHTYHVISTLDAIDLLRRMRDLERAVSNTLAGSGPEIGPEEHMPCSG